MGFESIVESFNQFNQNKKNGKHLSQGEILRNRLEAMDNMIRSSREGFESKKINKIDGKEKKHLKTLENKYNKLVSDYANSYKGFLLEHEKLQSDVMRCKSKCLEIHNQSSQDYANKRIACKAGCDIKAPYIVECKDTYKGLSSDSSKKCGHLVSGKCSGGSITLGQTGWVSDDSRSDKSGITLKDGCCDCGGGKGGKPKGIVNGTEVSSCNNLASAFGISAGSETDYIYRSACNQAGQTTLNVSANRNLYKKFNKIQEKNDKVSDAAKSLYEDIDKLHEIRKGLGESISSEEQKLKTNLGRFEVNYDELMKLGGKDPITGKPKAMNPTFIAMEEDRRLQEKSEQMKFYFWSILAIALAVSTMINFARKIE